MLRIENLHFAVQDLNVLNGVNLLVREGETIGIIGPNGSGKTTLFNCISGFNIPDKGRIMMRDQDVTRARPHRRARLGLGRVFQNFGIFKEMTVLENVLTAIESRRHKQLVSAPFRASAKRSEAMSYLREVALDSKANQKAGSLSGGQMRLLEIVRIMAFGAELLLLDEPTAGVSPKMKDDVAGLLRRLREMGKTVLIIEHDLNFIQSFCDRILVLDVGRVLLEDTPEKVQHSELLQEIYFGKTEKRNLLTAAGTAGE